MSKEPLFIPLKTEYYNAFLSGTKSEEFRRYGKGWNERTCAVGRRVVLSRGYGKHARIGGVITGFRKSQAPCKTAAWKDCYGDQVVDVACVEIQVDQQKDIQCPNCWSTNVVGLVGAFYVGLDQEGGIKDDTLGFDDVMELTGEFMCTDCETEWEE